MLVKPQCLRSPEKHDTAKHVPLDFKQPVGAVADQITDHRVACTHDAGEKHEPFRYVTGDITDAVDNAREFYDVQRIPPGSTYIHLPFSYLACARRGSTLPRHYDAAAPFQRLTPPSIGSLTVSLRNDD